MFFCRQQARHATFSAWSASNQTVLLPYLTLSQRQSLFPNVTHVLPVAKVNPRVLLQKRKRIKIKRSDCFGSFTTNRMQQRHEGPVAAAAHPEGGTPTPLPLVWTWRVLCALLRGFVFCFLSLPSLLLSSTAELSFSGPRIRYIWSF